MENKIDEAFDEMLDSVESINDNFVNEYFNTDIDFELPSDEELENEMNNVDLDTEVITNDEESWTEDVEEKNKDVVEDTLEKEETVEDAEENIEDKNEQIEEDLFNENYNQETEEILNEVNIDTDFINEKNDEFIISSDELMNLLDKTESSEEFFDKLEEKND